MTYREIFDRINMDFLDDHSPQMRGLQFEKLINEIFDSKNILVCPS